MEITDTPVVRLDGRTATAEQLTPLAFAGYAHFTAVQVRDGLIRGLDLHLARLRTASLEMFGRALPDAEVRSLIRDALADGSKDVSLTVTVYSTPGEFTAPAADAPPARPHVLVRTGPPADGPAGPLSLATVEYERPVPAIKHVGEVAKTYHLRRAVRDGFDDAVFVDRRGRLSEATIWNVAFWDGERVVWPDAEVLVGTMMSTVRRQLERMGVPQVVRPVTVADLPALAGAVVMNSWTPGVEVRRIGSVELPEAADFTDLLHRAHRAEPATAP
ncbi:aminotransferase class IV family protein [Streptomyces alkaliterrae]|uniref:Aminotransferase class IV family protein n=1 Tax=Streptomyces alkaliterrae TaxID=2213162 RepID=A0A5P0YUE7_9ACTN|nr:aminotransferase class IV family protein [Streptomyces alkaliterrae]MBB1261736.1 aminotransferase class IV family protein [Streptomyces alkaliterrae]MQS02099.1 branched-chain amino acid aminotransferase [Streptomyces alkaliterrae]